MKRYKMSLWISVASFWILTGTLRAQTPPALSVQIYAGVNIAGTTGSVYTIQYLANIAQSNSWTSLDFVQLPVTNYLWIDTSTTVGAHRFYRAVLQTPGTNLVFIPPATFIRGSSTNDLIASSTERPQTTVTLNHGFWMGKFEVTQGEYLAVTGNNPSTFAGDLSRPVESVGFPAASNYCAMLTQQDLAVGRIPAGTHYRLPTEAEWEYAARAGTSTQFYYGDDPNLTTLTNYAWFGATVLSTHPVGQKLPNAWGLYDMEGNVLEWCQDYFSPYQGGYEIDPKGPAAPFDFLSTFKVTRGGAYDTGGSECRSAARGIFGVSEFLTDSDLGFRVVLVADAQGR